jgi:hypothetical protein
MFVAQFLLIWKKQRVYAIFLYITQKRELHSRVRSAFSTHTFFSLMKSSLFVSFGSVFFLAWLALSYTTSLKPVPRLGKGSLPISSVKPAEKPLQSVAQEIASAK